MTFIPGGKGIRIECPGSSLPTDFTNIAYKAAAKLFSRTAQFPGIKIVIRKKTPIAAGLGGGSSNAAYVLVTLNDMFDFRLTRQELMDMGAEIGADVPFFIFGRTAWAFGKGERLKPAVGIPSMWLVLINPGFEISTKSVYGNLRIQLTKKVLKFNIPKFLTLQDIARGVRNDLETVTMGLHPVMPELKRLLVRHGALGSLCPAADRPYSGSSTGRRKRSAQRKKLKKRGIGLFLRRNLCNPLRVHLNSEPACSLFKKDCKLLFGDGMNSPVWHWGVVKW